MEIRKAVACNYKQGPRQSPRGSQKGCSPDSANLGGTARDQRAELLELGITDRAPARQELGKWGRWHGGGGQAGVGVSECRPFRTATLSWEPRHTVEQRLSNFSACEPSEERISHLNLGHARTYTQGLASWASCDAARALCSEQPHSWRRAQLSPS